MHVLVSFPGGLGMRLACGSEEVREGLSNHIRESVEDAQYMQHLSKLKPNNFTRKKLKAYLSFLIECLYDQQDSIIPTSLVKDS